MCAVSMSVVDGLRQYMYVCCRMSVVDGLRQYMYVCCQYVCCRWASSVHVFLLSVCLL